MLYAVPILLGVNLITFFLFFVVNSPDDMARSHLGNRHVTLEQINRWKMVHGYDKPLFVNTAKSGVSVVTDTLFWHKSLKLFAFDFGASDIGRDISHDIEARMWPSLALAIPILLVGLAVNISVAMLLTYFKATRIDFIGIVCCIILMSISSLFYVIGGQFLIAKLFKWVPISGYNDGFDALKFVILPVLIGVVSGVGAGGRWYRAIFLEEASKEYVLLARAKGFSEMYVLFKHVLRNALIPILTGIVVVIPSLFMGSLILESFFGIPGLGSYTIDAIQNQDFAVVRSMVFLGSLLYILGLVLTDLSYVIADPRIRLN